MEAFHSFWSEPNRGRNNGEVRFADYEQLTAILSALEWQKHNGEVRMITDSEGAEYFKKNGMDVFWNRIDVSLDGLKGNIDPFLFWAAGKLYALKTMPAPCVMLDTDLIIWKNTDWVSGFDVVAAHYEELYEDVYPDKSIFKLKPGYSFPKEWDFSVDAANTAYLYIKDAYFKDYYVNSAIEFFNNVEIDGLNPVTAMCFAEQRVLPMCAAAWGKSIGYLLELDEDAEEQETVTHIWGFKQLLDDMPEARHGFCMRLVNRIMTEFPERREDLARCTELRKYYDEYYGNIMHS